MTKEEILICCNSTGFSFFRADYECFQIELSKNSGMTEWRGDVKKIMMKAGIENLPKTFLFVYTQVQEY